MMQVVREHRDDLVNRVRVLTAVVTGLLVAIAAGFWFVQLVQGDYYRELAENNRLRKLPVKAPRGLIYDRKGRLLVENVPSYNLMIDRSRTEKLGRSLWFAAGVLGRPAAELQAILDGYRGIPEFKPVLLAENLTLSQVARFGVEGLEYPEFEVEVQHLRLYRHREQTAHVLGYLGEATEKEIADSNGAYQPGDLVGKKGIEQTYDAKLRGRDGERVVVVDSRGELLEEYKRVAAIPGKNLTLTIDLDLQQEAARWLNGPEKVGAVVAMDPRNGEILALVSAPSYNPNLFARRLQKDDWKALTGDPNHPLQNRAIQNTYSPGSTFKIIMATAGLTEGIFNEHIDRRLRRRQVLLRPPLPLLEEGRARHGQCPPGAQASPATSTSTPSARRWASSGSPATRGCSAWARPPASTSRARRRAWCPTRSGARRCASTPGTRARRSRSRSARGRC